MKLLISIGLVVFLSLYLNAEQENEKVLDSDQEAIAFPFKRNGDSKRFYVDESSANDLIHTHCGRNRFDDLWSKYLVKMGRRRRSQVAKRIVGGRISNVGEWPWLVSLMVRVKKGLKMHLCGGTLISPHWIVTAAHCFEANVEYPMLSTNPEIWTVRIGEHDMLKQDTPHLDLKLQKIIMHPKRHSMFYDIALLKLKKPVNFTEYANVACLPTAKDNPRVGEECYAAGWGREFSEAKNISMVLKHVNVPIVSNEQCKKDYRKLSEDVFDLIKDTMICAGAANGGRDACQFDSGGPLMCMKNGQWLFTGVISFGYKCGMPGYPGIYTRVPKLVSWIQKVTVIN